MHTRTDEIADGVYRISTLVDDVPPRGFTFNQFLLDAEEPLLYHTGMRSLFPLVSEAVAAVVPLERLRWIAFAHVEADECGAVEQFLAAAPRAQVAHGALGCQVSLDDMLSRPPVPLADGQVLDLGGKELRLRRVRHVDTPHVPHNWESRVLFEEQTGTLLCGDLGSQLGQHEPLLDDLVDPAIEAEQVFRASSLSPALPATLRRLAALEPSTLAIMHGSSYKGDGAAALSRLAEAYEHAFPELCLPGEVPAVPPQVGSVAVDPVAR
ncbi:MAG: MBL fold metallo-hydrolase [Actinomycetota bacterium]|nr:MBL fold metallo-hydrolase [Actinomycetota bacterium]